MIIQTSLDVPDELNLNTEEFMYALEKFIAKFGDIALDEFEVIKDSD